MHPQDHARSLTDRGRAALGAGEAERALACYDDALRFRSDYAPALYGRCLALQALGRAADVIAACDRALNLNPTIAGLHYNRAVGLRMLNRWAEAEAGFRRVIALQPDAGDAFAGLGTVLDQQGRTDEARRAYEAAIVRNPADADSLNNLGNLLARCGERQLAIEKYCEAIQHRSGFAEALNNLGTALAAGGDHEGAFAKYRQALSLKPEFVPALVNLGASLADAGRHQAALGAYDRALALDPENAQARWNRGLARLFLRDFAGGWEDYAARWRTNDFISRRREFPQPGWRGESAAGRKILLWSEQGIGDEIMFLGLMPELIAEGASIVLECDARLIPLVARSQPQIELIARSEVPDAATRAPDIALQAPTGDLLRWLRPTVKAIRPLAGYLKAETARTAELRIQYRGQHQSRLLGLSWHSTNPKNGRWRSIPPPLLAPFLRLPGWRTFDLQYGNRTDDRGEMERSGGGQLLHDPSIDSLRDVDGWAAQIAAMDAVVTIDNSAAHLAAALGKPVLLLLPVAPDWRWFASGETTPWYAGMRLLRQTEHGDWTGPIARALGMLAAWQD
jgi:tetratricopeptide (TPR) repeat protein